MIKSNLGITYTCTLTIMAISAVVGYIVGNALYNLFF